MCNNCIHKIVCSKYIATGGVKKCEHYREGRKAVWIVDDYDSGEPGCYEAFIEVHCSGCGYDLGAASGEYEWCYGEPFPLQYCPNCGADMRGKEDG